MSVDYVSTAGNYLRHTTAATWNLTQFSIMGNIKLKYIAYNSDPSGAAGTAIVAKPYSDTVNQYPYYQYLLMFHRDYTADVPYIYNLLADNSGTRHNFSLPLSDRSMFQIGDTIFAALTSDNGIVKIYAHHRRTGTWWSNSNSLGSGPYAYTSSLWLGAMPPVTSTGQHSDELYDCRFYNAALSESDIKTIGHLNGADKITDHLLGRWLLLNNGKDYSGHGNDMAETGTIPWIATPIRLSFPRRVN